MADVISIKDKTRIRRGRLRRLEQIKEELLRLYGIDLDQLLANEPVQGLTLDEFQELTEGILHVIEKFCAEHPTVTVQDLLYTLDISFPEAALGTVIQVPTLDGRAKLKIPPGTQSGTFFRLKRKGVGYSSFTFKTPT